MKLLRERLQVPLRSRSENTYSLKAMTKCSLIRKPNMRTYPSWSSFSFFCACLNGVCCRRASCSGVTSLQRQRYSGLTEPERTLLSAQLRCGPLGAPHTSQQDPHRPLNHFRKAKGTRIHAKCAFMWANPFQKCWSVVCGLCDIFSLSA